MVLNLKLTKFIAEIDHPAPIYFQRRSNEWLKQVRKLARDQGLLPTDFSGISLDCLDILRAELNMKNGIILSHLAIAQKILEEYPNEEILIEEAAAANSVSELAQFFSDGRKRIKSANWMPLIIPRVRLFAYRVRQRIASQKFLSNKIDLPTNKVRGKLFVLSRHVSHLKVILPVVSYLRERHNIQILFGVLTSELDAACKNAGFESVNLTRLNSNSTVNQQLKLIRTELFEFLSTLKTEHFPFELTDVELTALKRETKQVLKNNLLYSMHVVEAVKSLLEKFHPSLFFASNPYTMEGRAATYAAKSFNIPTSSAEHGTIFPNDPIWQECLVDLVCVYGEPSRRALLTCGVRPEQITVTGAPQLDKIYKLFEWKNPQDEAIILVATSGPGDQVSLEQHLRFINILYRAAAISSDLRWVVKLHPKDHEHFYKNIAKEFPAAHVEILERSPFGKSIFDYLMTSKALVTLYSTCALDAMLMNIPVITVALASKEKDIKGIEFIDLGCTLRVETAEELAQAARKIRQGKGNKQIAKNALDYTNIHYANLGNATENTAMQLLNLMGAINSEQ